MNGSFLFIKGGEHVMEKLNGSYNLEEKGLEEVTAQVMDVYNDGAIDSVYLKEKERTSE